ncbi:hypothetical protein ACIP2Z_38935 [Streptomyces iakyrus]|uniref:Uncharacterized protein n=1 Tax=Streptomyces iakyrus TaxID=68219 RepID=A0ABW8FS47_9ACTN
MTVPVRASDLEHLVPYGWDLETDPDIISRYENAPDLPGPIQAVASDSGKAPTAMCPQCDKAVEKVDQDGILAVDPNVFFTGRHVRTLWGDQRTVASLLSLTGCGHTFRVLPGQTIAEVREQSA